MTLERYVEWLCRQNKFEIFFWRVNRTYDTRTSDECLCLSLCLSSWTKMQNSKVVKAELSDEKPHFCAKCDKQITERYFLKALNLFWHESCLKCGCCDCRLGDVGTTLFTRDNFLLCRSDYLRWVFWREKGRGEVVDGDNLTVICCVLVTVKGSDLWMLFSARKSSYLCNRPQCPLSLFGVWHMRSAEMIKPTAKQFS